MQCRRRSRRFFIAAVLWLSLLPHLAAAEPLAFQLRFDPAVSRQPFTGRVYVLLSARSGPLPSGPSWFNPEPFYALDVVNWEPGQVRSLTAAALGHPKKLDQLRPGKYWVRAVMDFNRGDRSFLTG